MIAKITAMMLLATALPFSKASAHSGTFSRPPMNGYLYFMLGVGTVYFLYLMIRMQRRSNRFK